MIRVVWATELRVGQSMERRNLRKLLQLNVNALKAKGIDRIVHSAPRGRVGPSCDDRVPEYKTPGNGIIGVISPQKY